MKIEKKKAHISLREPIPWIKRLNDYIAKANEGKEFGKTSQAKIIYTAVNKELDILEKELEE
jgi:hypothetical protein